MCINPRKSAHPGHPPWGSEHGLYVVDVDAWGALMGREQSNPAGSHEAGGSQLSMGIPWTHRRYRRVPKRETGIARARTEGVTCLSVLFVLFVCTDIISWYISCIYHDISCIYHTSRIMSKSKLDTNTFLVSQHDMVSHPAGRITS